MISASLPIGRPSIQRLPPILGSRPERTVDIGESLWDCCEELIPRLPECTQESIPECGIAVGAVQYGDYPRRIVPAEVRPDAEARSSLIQLCDAQAHHH